MALSIEMADKFGRTALDFLSLGPIQFQRARERTSDKYLSHQFLVGTLTLCLSMFAVQLALIDGVMADLGNSKPSTDPIVRASRLLILTFVVFVGSSLYSTVVSRWWPIRSPIRFRSAFEVGCYPQSALLLALTPLDVIVAPMLTKLELRHFLPALGTFTYLTVVFVLSTIFEWFYLYPGLAALARVSRLRMIGGHVFWSFTPSFVLSLILTLCVLCLTHA